MPTESEIIFSLVTCVGNKKVARITLNKPKSLNALSLNMVESIQTHIDECKADPNVVAILINASGEKAFCAGGDIQSMYKSMIKAAKKNNDDRSLAELFFEKEYKLNYSLITYPKPIIIFGHGIIMGGGQGIFNGGTFRIVTEKSRVAMPEICIGLYPDVGASDFLNKLPKNMGRFLALTGSSINATDCLQLGLATHFVASEDLADLQSQISTIKYGDNTHKNNEIIRATIEDYSQKSENLKPQSIINKHEDFIADLFSEPDTRKLLDNFLSTNIEDEWLAKAKKNIEYGSPLSALIIDKQLHRAKKYTLKQTFESELVLSCNITRFTEFAEGVRALIVDKDFKPNWAYSNHHLIPETFVDDFFVPPWNTNPLKSLGEG